MLLLHIFALLKHWSSTALLRLMRQTVPLALNELLFQSFEEKPIESNHVLHFLLIFIHHLQARQPLVRQIVARHFHCNLFIRFLHLRHIDKLAEKVLVHRQHTGALAARAYL